MKSITKYFREKLLLGVARQADLDRLYRQLEGLSSIQNAIEGKPVLRPMRNWAISPDVMAYILPELQGRDAPTVVEFGSGQSTVILAAALKQVGGHLVSVEHDPVYAEAIQRQANSCGLIDVITFIDAPLREAASTPGDISYDVSIIPGCLVDIVLIDGPPCTNGPLTRLTPLRWAAEHLKPDGCIFLDDSARGPEQLCLKQLEIEFSNLNMVARDTEKGLTELRWR
jgi:predicted O-methyltransferase YrrM